MVADKLVGQAPAALGDLVLPFQPPVGGHAHAGEEVHSFLMGAVDQHGQRVQAPVDQALHVLPGAPVGGDREGTHVGAKTLAHPGGIEETVPPLHPVDKGVHRRSRHLVNGHPGVLHGHGRLEHVEVVVPGVVVIEGPFPAPGMLAGERLGQEAGRGAGHSCAAGNSEGLHEFATVQAHGDLRGGIPVYAFGVVG